MRGKIAAIAAALAAVAIGVVVAIATTSGQVTAQALVVQTAPGHHVDETLHGAHIASVTTSVVAITAHGATATQAKRAASRAVRDYLASDPGSKLLNPPAVRP